MDENEEINNLHERTCGLRRLYNSAASINAKLPVEILVEIFRLAGPSFGPKEAIISGPGNVLMGIIVLFHQPSSSCPMNFEVTCSGLIMLSIIQPENLDRLCSGQFC